MTYIYAKEGEKPAGCDKSLRIYYDEHGNEMIRSEGSRSWRNNNPGNLKYYPFARDNGAIGTDGTFAIFPDEQTGQNARKKLLQGSKYFQLTLHDMASVYEPERPDPYCDCFTKKANLDSNRTLNSLSNDEFQRLLEAMQQCEGWEVGEENHFPLLAIIGTKRGKDHTFQDFQIKDRGWKTKNEAIEIAEKENLCATIVYMKNGNKYLRSKPNQPSFSELICS
jgi:hypothetical protein